MIDLNNIHIRGMEREKRLKHKKEKYIKHGEGEIWGKKVHKQNTGISRQWKKKWGLK